MQFLPRIVLLLPCLLLVPGVATAQDKRQFTQTIERPESVERGTRTAPTDVAKPQPIVLDKDFNSGPTPDWIWGKDNARNYVLRTRFKVEKVKLARLKASSDNSGC